MTFLRKQSSLRANEFPVITERQSYVCGRRNNDFVNLMRNYSKKVKIVFLWLCIFSLGVLCACALYKEPTFKREITPRDSSDAACRSEMIRLVNDVSFPKVSFDHATPAEALDWLSKNGNVGISSLNLTTNLTVSFTMTNAHFLAVLDQICDQSDRYWGFGGRVLMTLPKSIVDERADWIRRGAGDK